MQAFKYCVIYFQTSRSCNLHFDLVNIRSQNIKTEKFSIFKSFQVLHIYFNCCFIYYIVLLTYISTILAALRTVNSIISYHAVAFRIATVLLAEKTDCE